MKIAIPVNENHSQTTVCPSYGRAPYFLIYDDENKEKIFVQNQATLKQGGAGIFASQFLLDQSVDVVIVTRMGKNAAEVLQQGNVKIYQSLIEGIDQILQDYEDEKLKPLLNVHPGFHQHGQA